ncbi:MAG: flagellar basal-body rod protein FlgB [Pelagibacteraceae bacterium TMED65]|nr:flagellar basal body rod protein FlgB [Rickettsiales bacterium]OUU53126.1 MAG: flagellar basal-body rod protein FlgB [Pelagibacteraceae bacterium TMED65]|tara:strand:+ start:1492 stop:1881 length:390 start_codon:yes stop_codon:yes gene_type:complete
MVDNIKQQLDVLSNALSVRNRKQEILASNIANAATPQYKARDVEFEVELARLLNEGPLKTSDSKHIGLVSKNLPGKVQYRQSVNPSVDGNTVELAVEQMEFAENAVRYQTTLDFINSKVRGLMSAIRGE